ncbi:MAG: hypothetical protein AB8B97_00100 [Granulosicoccus sp.]
MNDLLAVLLVGLVLATALVSIFAILTGSSEHYSEDDYPRPSNQTTSGNSEERVRPMRRSSDRSTAVASPFARQSSTPKRQRKEGVAS